MKPSRAEITILKNIDSIYKYIARDANGSLTIYEVKPTKSVSQGIWDGERYSQFNAFSHLFKWICWGDKEPVVIKEVINRE